jgi:hypothetical protein
MDGLDISEIHLVQSKDSRALTIVIVREEVLPNPSSRSDYGRLTRALEKSVTFRFGQCLCNLCDTDVVWAWLKGT